METWLPNKDNEIVKLDLFKTTQDWAAKLRETAGLYNEDEGYITYISDKIAFEYRTPLNNNRYLFDSKVTFRVPIFYVKATMNVSGNKSATYGIYATPKIMGIVFVENRITKQYHFKLEIKMHYDLYNPGAGSSSTDYKFSVKGFKNPSVSINLREVREYSYQTFAFNTKEISAAYTNPTEVALINQSSSSSDDSSQIDVSPSVIGDDHVTLDVPNPKSRQINWKSRITQFFRRKEK